MIGKQNPYALIDTGEGRQEYIPILESALREIAKPSNTMEPDVSDIIISHWHLDHVGGLPSVLSLLRKLWEERNPSLPYKSPRLHKFPCDIGSVEGLKETHTISSIIHSLSPDTYTPSPNGCQFHDLRDSQVITSSELQVIHTPGHTVDSVCLYVQQDKALYTSDTVLGEGTAIFEDLSTYMNSLEKILLFGDGIPDREYRMLYPGHGPVVSDGRSLIREYIRHRHEREEEILKLLHTSPPASGDSSSKYWTTWSIVTTLYAGYPESLWPAAARVITLHLRKLQDEGIVKKVGGEGEHASWELVDILSSSPVNRNLRV